MSTKEQKSEETNAPTVLGWVIRCVSIAVLASLAGFLIFKMAQPQRNIALTVEPLAKEARLQNGQTLLPVDITNTGTATIREMRLELSAGTQANDITIKMLGHGETVRYVIDVPDSQSSVTHRIVTYEAP